MVASLLGNVSFVIKILVVCSAAGYRESSDPVGGTRPFAIVTVSFSGLMLRALNYWLARRMSACQYRLATTALLRFGFL